MTKLRTETELQSALDGDYAWRVKEIDQAKQQAREAEGARRRMAVRAGLPLVYAHWEGFVKNASENALNFVSSQRRVYRDLLPCFVAHGLKRQLATVVSSSSHSRRAEAVEFLLSKLSTRASLSWRGAISTQSNLSSTVFAEIAAALAIDATRYEARYNFIDESLLKRRNRIAHGEYLDLDPDGFIEVANNVLTLMRDFKTDIENMAVTQGYLRQPPVVTPAPPPHP